MRSLIIVFGALLAIILLPSTFGSVHDARVDSYTQTAAGVTTGAGIYAANVTLSQDLWGDAVSLVSDVSSNITADSPSASTYNPVSGALLVGGLEQGQLRTLSITYEVESATTTEMTGLSTFLALFFWFLVFLIIALLGGAIYAFWT